MIYKIADLYVEMQPQFNRMTKQSVAYQSTDLVAPDITIDIPSNVSADFEKSNPHLDAEMCEYLLFGAEFYNQLINFNGILLHGSAVALDGQVYIFTAPSGVGKSTHTGLWLEHFGKRAEIINDDKPAIRIVNDQILAFGTPFSGKYDISKNIGLPLKAICIIERGETDSISPVSKKQAYFEILNQTVRPKSEAAYSEVLNILETIINNVPIYKLKATISENAVITSYEGMNNQ